MIKFKRGDQVCITYGSAATQIQAMTKSAKISGCRANGPSGGPEYRVSGFSGWWPEKYLMLVSKGPKNPYCCDKSSEPITNTQNETKCDTGDSGASGDSQYVRELYLKALKKTYGKMPFESETVEVGSLLDFTEAVLKATKEVKE